MGAVIAMLVTVLATMSTEAGDVTAPPVAPAAALPSAARAQWTMPAPPMPEASLERPAPKRWYGWELMLSDAAFVTLGSRYGRSGSAPALLGAVVGVTLGTPLLHVANGNGRAGMRSIIVRSATWLAAGAALFVSEAFPSTSCHGDVCSTSPDPTLPVAMLVAGALFALVDDTVLATVLTAPDPGLQVATARPFAPARFVPTLSPTAGGATMGLGGVF